MELVNELETLKTADQIRERLDDPALANYVVCWMRLIASAELQKQPDFYINFLPDVASVADFCRLVGFKSFFERNFFIVFFLVFSLSENSKNKFTSIRYNQNFKEVEPLGVDIDHVVITALSTGLGTPVRVACLERREGEAQLVDFFGEEAKINLMFQPGHYDILYK